MKAMTITCKGRVQGVFFRASTLEVAKQLNLTGWVKNLGNGDVLIHAEGDAPSLEKLISWCKNGPQLASVTDVITADATFESFNTFDIKR